MEVKKLKSIRNGNRSAVTRLLRKTDDLKDSSEFDKEDLLASYDNLVEKKKLLDSLNEQILNGMETEDIEDEIVITDEYTLNLDTKLRHLRNFIQSISSTSSRQSHNQQTNSTYQILNVESPPFIPTMNTENPQTSYMYNAPSSASSSNQTHRLPKLTLPTFAGNILQWQTFWDSFESAVHLNNTLSDVQKFNYLRSQLENEALQTITGFALTNANYIEAVNTLKERYGQTHKITQAYMNALLKITPPKNNLHSLREFYDKLEASVRGLEALGQSQETYGTLLVPIILNKLPGEIKQHLAREHGSNTWILRDLRKSIQNEINIIEAGQDYDMRQNYSNTPTCTFLAKAESQRRYRTAVNVKNDHRSLTTKPCVFCQEIHAPINCTRVTDPKERMQIVKRNNLCFNCLGSHHVSECKSKHVCRHCNKRHHSSLCNGTHVSKGTSYYTNRDVRYQNNSSRKQENRFQPVNVHFVNDNDEKDDKDATILHSSSRKHSSVLLKTAVAPVWSDCMGTDANILFDEGSQRSFVTEELVRKLNLKTDNTEVVQLSSFGETGNNVRHLDKCKLLIETETGRKIPIDVLVVPMIAVPLQNHIRQLGRNSSYLRGLHLAHPSTDDDTFQISVLIGADYYWHFVEDHVIRGDGPIAVKSKLGYLLSGPLKEGMSRPSTVSAILNLLISHKTEEHDIESFWKLESIGINSSEADEEGDSYLRKYEQSSIEFRGGQYIARLPWKQDHEELQTNFNATKRRTENVIRRLRQDPDMLKRYGNIISEQELRGFIEQVNENDVTSNTVNYIPHHPVMKDSSTTPLRVVYDCSFKPTKIHPSLNDCLADFPPQLNDLVNIMVRFRRNPVAIATDIEKAFLHVGLHEDDRDVTRFLWLSDPTNPNSFLKTYRFRSVLFGATCSPFILSATLSKHLQLNPSELSEQLEKDLYVDNILSSVETENDAVGYFMEARKMMSKAGFNLRSWSSNSSEVRKQATIQHVLDTDKYTKVLGMRWNSETDELFYPKREIAFPTEVTTKRQILKHSSRIYDPLGLLNPVTVRAKLLLQELWKGHFEWDEPLPEDTSKSWIDLATDIENSTMITYPRYYFQKSTNVTETTLQVFVDASTKAYGAVAYICDGKQSSLVISKTRVAPVKELTLPQLELMAAVIGARLTHFLLPALNCKSATLWSDSKIVLHWLSSTKQLKRFISNRVREIKDLTTACEWKYCSTTVNPADLLTRGITSAQLKSSILWIKGPDFLVTDEIETQFSNVGNIHDTALSLMIEDSQETGHSVEDKDQEEHQEEQLGIHIIMDSYRYGSYRKLLNVTSYILRFIENCRNVKESRKIGALKPDEIQKSTILWIRNCQESAFATELGILKSNDRTRRNIPRISQLRLFLDENGLLRCEGRIHNAPIPEDTKFPFLLPANHRFSELVVMDSHENVLHSGVNTTVAFIRQRFWIPAIRQFVRKILRKCVTCRKVTGRPYPHTDIAPLQKMRLKEAPPFTSTGIDFSGALNIRNKDKTISKAYICLFTCASTRAIHLEVVPNLTEDSFLQAFRRFVSRKSTPKVIMSDNATTFVAASEHLKQLINSEKIQQTFSNRGIEWRFIPKGAPWFGGFWERMIGLTKNCLKKVLGSSLIDLESLQTVTTEVENILNDRPLTYISSDIDDNEPLTPAHLLYGRRITSLSHLQNIETDYTNVDLSDISNRAKRLTLLLQHFWARWKTEYLVSLREYQTKNGRSEINVKRGDIVQIERDGPRIGWKTAIIEEVIRGNDGLARSAVLRTANGKTSRPLVKLYPLEIHCDDTAVSDDTTTTELNPCPGRTASVRAKEKIKEWTNVKFKSKS